MAKPDKLRIAYEDSEHGRFDCVGQLPDGTQFMAFVTGTFSTREGYYLADDWPDKKRWLAVVHRFDADGAHTSSETRLDGFDIEGRDVAGKRAFGHLQDMLTDLANGGPLNLCDIWVRLFSVEIEGVMHGRFYEQSVEEPGEEEEAEEWVLLEPWDIMFHPPWDSSEYST